MEDICVDLFPIVNTFNLDYLFQKCSLCVKNAYHDCDRVYKYIEQIIQLSTKCSLVSRVFVNTILSRCYVHKYPVRIFVVATF